MKRIFQNSCPSNAVVRIPHAESSSMQHALTLHWHFAQTIVQGIEATEIVPGRCEVIDEDQPFGCVVDAADTPAALSRLMDGLRECHPKRLILVLGCPGEQDQGKRPFMGEIAHYKVRTQPVSTALYNNSYASRYTLFHTTSLALTRRQDQMQPLAK